MRWRAAIHWLFAMIFFVAAACASSHAEFALQGQPAPACSHEPSGDDQQPVTHCTDCMQVHYLQESPLALDSVPSLPVIGSLLVLPRGISVLALPILNFAPHELIASSPPILRV